LAARYHTLMVEDRSELTETLMESGVNIFRIVPNFQKEKDRRENDSGDEENDTSDDDENWILSEEKGQALSTDGDKLRWAVAIASFSITLADESIKRRFARKIRLARHLVLGDDHHNSEKNPAPATPLNTTQHISSAAAPVASAASAASASDIAASAASAIAASAFAPAASAIAPAAMVASAIAPALTSAVARVTEAGKLAVGADSDEGDKLQSKTLISGTVFPLLSDLSENRRLALAPFLESLFRFWRSDIKKKNEASRSQKKHPKDESAGQQAIAAINKFSAQVKELLWMLGISRPPCFLGWAASDQIRESNPSWNYFYSGSNANAGAFIAFPKLICNFLTIAKGEIIFPAANLPPLSSHES
jgi:hypothetical protein